MRQLQCHDTIGVDIGRLATELRDFTDDANRARGEVFEMWRGYTGCAVGFCHFEEYGWRSEGMKRACERCTPEVEVLKSRCKAGVQHGGR